MWHGLEAYKGEAAFGKGFRELLKPLSPSLQQRGVSEHQFVAALAEAHVRLGDPRLPQEQRLAFATELLRGYGLTLTPQSPEGDDDGEVVSLQVKHLTEQVASLQSHLNGYEQTRAQEIQQQLAVQLDEFAKDPAHPYFDEVCDDIVILLRGAGGNLTLQEAYDKAVYANPVTRQKEVDRLAKQQREAAEKAARETAEKAAKATAANVKSSDQRGAAAPSTGSMDDTMKETLRAIRSREARA